MRTIAADWSLPRRPREKLPIWGSVPRTVSARELRVSRRTSGCLGQGLKLDRVSEFGELGDQMSGLGLGRASIEMMGAKILKLGTDLGERARTVSARELSFAADIRLPRPGAEAGPCIRVW